jgi:hypothetical protein
MQKNSKIAKRCISTAKEKYGGQLNHEQMSLEQDMPIEIAKRISLKERFSVN